MHSDTETSSCSDPPSDSEAMMLDAPSESDPLLPGATVHNQEQQSDIVDASSLDTNESIKSKVIGELFIQETELPGTMEIFSKSEPMSENREVLKEIVKIHNKPHSVQDVTDESKLLGTTGAPTVDKLEILREELILSESDEQSVSSNKPATYAPTAGELDVLRHELAKSDSEEQPTSELTLPMNLKLEDAIVDEQLLPMLDYTVTLKKLTAKEIDIHGDTSPANMNLETDIPPIVPTLPPTLTEDKDTDARPFTTQDPMPGKDKCRKLKIRSKSSNESDTLRYSMRARLEPRRPAISSRCLR